MHLDTVKICGAARFEPDQFHVCLMARDLLQPRDNLSTRYEDTSTGKRWPVSLAKFSCGRQNIPQNDD